MHLGAGSNAEYIVVHSALNSIRTNVYLFSLNVDYNYNTITSTPN